MNVRVQCFGAMRDFLPPGAVENRATLQVEPGSTVATVLETLGAPARLAHWILIDGARVELDLPVVEGVEVTLMPPFTGGAQARS